jgi:hypothetical protein
MTPRELLKQFEENMKGKNEFNHHTGKWEVITEDNYYLDLSGYTSEKKHLLSYQYDNCVVAYAENSLGIIMLIKGKNEFFGYIITFEKFRGYNLFRKEIIDIYKLLNLKNHDLNIIEPELYKRFIARVGLIELEK